MHVLEPFSHLAKIISVPFEGIGLFLYLVNDLFESSFRCLQLIGDWYLLEVVTCLQTNIVSYTLLWWIYAAFGSHLNSVLLWCSKSRQISFACIDGTLSLVWQWMATSSKSWIRFLEFIWLLAWIFFVESLWAPCIRGTAPLILNIWPLIATLLRVYASTEADVMWHSKRWSNIPSNFTIYNTVF